MITRTFAELSRDVEYRRRVRDLPPVVLLGAGASVESGIAAMGGLFELVQCATFDEFVTYIETRNASERYRLLADFLQTRDPAEVTPGYRALATLCAETFFDVVLTTNLDPLLDDALASARLWRRDYLLLVNGVVRADRIEPLLQAQSPRVKVVKLHGDLFHRFMAWTPAEMNAYLQDVSPLLRAVLRGRDVLVVGHSLRDDRIRDLVFETGGAVWYVGPGAVPDVVASSDRVRAVVGPTMTFETVFTDLADALGVEVDDEVAPPPPSPMQPAPRLSPSRFAGTARPAPAAPAPGAGTPPDDVGEAAAVSEPLTPATGATTMDDFMASVVGIAFGDNPPSMTGFVLADPRMIVTDGFDANWPGDRDTATVVGPGGRRVATQVRSRYPGHPFGPVTLDLPPGLTVPGLALADETGVVGTRVHAGVAAGERVGISSGTIAGVEQTLEVAPVGAVESLVQLELVTAPGASGAPVVDQSFRVQGFIVAGSTDPLRPQSYFYPSARWWGVV